MINNSQARAAAAYHNINFKKGIDTALNKITKIIENAANSGHYSVYVLDFQATEILEILTDYGYEVERMIPATKGIKIIWGDC